MAKFLFQEFHTTGSSHIILLLYGHVTVIYFGYHKTIVAMVNKFRYPAIIGMKSSLRHS